LGSRRRCSRGSQGRRADSILPTATLWVDGVEYAIPVEMTAEGIGTIDEWTLSTDEFEVTLSATLDADPFTTTRAP
jgi:hypothetical protein